MAHILGIGVATLDIINTTDGFPNEDDKVRAVSQRINRGGNVCNSLTVLSQLGHTCSWCGTLGDDHAADVIRAELAQHNIDMTNSHRIVNGRTPTSYVTINQLNGSRTIVHHRDLAELNFEHFAQLNFSNIDCCHFEGRNVGQTELMLAHLRHHHPDIILSIEIEKPRPSIDKLYPNADILFFSRDFAKQQTYSSAAEFLDSPNLTQAREKSIMVCTWGNQGAWLVAPGQALYHQAAITVDKPVDTLGSGDTFIAGFLHQWLLDKDAHRAVKFAASIAAKKCRQTGFEQLVKPS